MEKLVKEKRRSKTLKSLQQRDCLETQIFRKREWETRTCLLLDSRVRFWRRRASDESLICFPWVILSCSVGETCHILLSQRNSSSLFLSFPTIRESSSLPPTVFPRFFPVSLPCISPSCLTEQEWTRLLPLVLRRRRETACITCNFGEEKREKIKQKHIEYQGKE